MCILFGRTSTIASHVKGSFLNFVNPRTWVACRNRNDRITCQSASSWRYLSLSVRSHMMLCAATTRIPILRYELKPHATNDRTQSLRVALPEHDDYMTLTSNSYRALLSNKASLLKQSRLAKASGRTRCNTILRCSNASDEPLTKK